MEKNDQKRTDSLQNREIERKWLVKKLPENLEEYGCLMIEQAYLCASPTVRVRKENEEYYLTYKSSRNMPGNSAISHEEYNLPLDVDSYKKLLNKHDGRIIKKRRYLIPLDDGLTAELDVFEGELSPLMVVEVEFDTENEAYEFEGPEWFGEDVSEDYKYKNSYLALGE